jgi:HAD superfamily hydrolase (TIGR01459 family)
MLEKLKSLTDLGDKYDVILSDVWGVLHNGVSVYEGAPKVLSALRKAGKTVILITNSPRRKQGVASQLEMLGVPPEAYDDIVTSGDLTRHLIKQMPKNVFFLGPDRDLQILDGLDVVRVKAEEAEAIVCTGMFDDNVEKPEDYSDMLAEFKARNLPFVCANPDLIVERGERMIPCAGAVAQLYKQIGGDVYVAGKPHKPMYQTALEIASKIRGEIDQSRVVAIGDGMPTDVKGAINYGLDLVFVAHGIHIQNYGDSDNIDELKLTGFLAKQGVRPNYWMEWVC